MTNYYVKYEVTFTPSFWDPRKKNNQIKHRPVSFKGEVTIPIGAMMESGESVKSAEDAGKVFWARYLGYEDELIDCSEVPFFDDGYATALKVLSFGEVEDH